MTGSARVAVVLAAALAGALLLGGVALRAAGPTTTAAVDPTGREGLAPTPRPTPATERADRVDRAVRSDRVDRTEADPGRSEVSPPRARPASLDRGSPRPAAVPTGLLVPAAGIRMPVAPRGVDEQGLMALPDSPFEAGWYRWGAAPRDRRGAVVVAGHVDTAEEGIGPLAAVAGLGAGDRIVLSGPGGGTAYRVTSVRRVPKSVLDLPALFRRTGPPALHLVTCGGEFDPVSRSYRDNVVVVAERSAGARSLP